MFVLFLRLLTPPFSSFLFSRSQDADSVRCLKKFFHAGLEPLLDADFICWLKMFCLSRSLTAVRLDPAISLMLIAPSPRYSGPTKLISFYPRFSIFLLFLRLLTPPFSSFLFSRSRGADSICWLRKFFLKQVLNCCKMQILSAGLGSFV